MKHSTFLRQLFVLLFCICAGSAAAQQRRLLFDEDWRFCLGDPEGAGQASYDDSSWRTLDLPHDWSVESDFQADAPAGNDGGYLPTGIGWYRKTFRIGELKGRRYELYFEGVYERSDVYVNGHRAGGRPYGYSSFRVDITPYLHKGKGNVVAVRADNSQQKNCRWYSGSGIYRHVWLYNLPETHLKPWGIFARSERMQDRSYRIRVETEVANAEAAGGNVTLRHTLYDGDRRVSQSSGAASAEHLLRVALPRLWSPESPHLYRIHTELFLDGKKVDETYTTTALRTFSYSAADGMRLNGRRIILNGGCVHHDNGVLGAAAFDDAEARKVRLLKEAGFNAVRTSHNPPSEAFLDECDRQGLLVIDEAFDGWYASKNAHDYHELIGEWWQEDIRSMVLRDRNHPSVFCWSIGNEVIERKEARAVATAHQLAGLVRQLDPSRPVTSAITTWDATWAEWADKLGAEHDIMGYNYQIHRAASDHERVPGRVIMQTESYPREAFRNASLVRENNYIIGDFVWTALDYLGESGIGRFFYEGETPGEHYERNQFPWHGAYCGDIDLTGWRKPISHYRDMLYREDFNSEAENLYMAVREPNGYRGKVKETMWSVWPTWESWTWPGHEGKPIEVEIYSLYPSVSLYLNGKLVATGATGYGQEHKAVLRIPYEPGTLCVKALDQSGQPVDSCVLETAGAPAALRLTADRTGMPADGQALTFVTVEIVDAQGRLCPEAALPLRFSAEGPARLIATGSADLKDRAAYVRPERTSWKGRAIAVLRASQRAGATVLRVEADGLPAASVTIGDARNEASASAAWRK